VKFPGSANSVIIRRTASAWIVGDISESYCKRRPVKKTDPSVSVILPLYGNEETLPELVKRLIANLGDRSFEIVGVDDHSFDKSADVLSRETAEIGIGCQVIRNSINRGQHPSIISGLAQAEGQYSVVMDADLQNPPEAVPRLVESLEHGNSAIVFGRRKESVSSWPERFTSSLFKRTVIRLMNANLPSEIGAFFAITGEAKERLLSLRVERPYLLPMLLALGLPVGYVDYELAPNPHSVSGYTFATRLALGLRGLRLALRLRGIEWPGDNDDQRATRL